MQKSASLLLWIDLLRPIDWIEHHAVIVGETVHLDLVEMGAVGEAEVLAVEPCPPIKSGPGTVVIGKFVHECRDAELVELRIEGQSESVRVTPEHPYWSEDREEFVPVGELSEGERVSTTKGQQRIASLTRTTYTGMLYNLETTEHVFRVGTNGALVHNMCITPNKWESLAARQLEKKGYKILGNIENSSGNGLDIVARHKKTKELLVVEVKARADGWGSLSDLQLKGSNRNAARVSGNSIPGGKWVNRLNPGSSEIAKTIAQELTAR